MQPTAPSSQLPPEPHQNYYAAIDGLRALAVIAVIINHLDHATLPSGYLGVDIFFVISGYVITASLAGRKDQTAAKLLSGFYQRRIKRLLPALATCVLLTSFFFCFFNPEPLAQLKTAAYSLVGLSNIQLHFNAVDYWGESAEINPFTHTWSLGVEEQFYVVFPMLICSTVIGSWSPKNRTQLKLSIALLSIISLAWFLLESRVNASSAYYLMHFRFWELGAGCLLYLLLSEKANLKLRIADWHATTLVLAALLATLFIPVKYSALATLLAVSLTTTLIALTRLQPSKFRLLDNKMLVGIGLISYSLYLWHWPVIVISRLTIGIHWWTVPIQLAIILAFSLASYLWIEKPFRKCLWLDTKIKAYTTASVASMYLALLTLILVSSNSQTLYLGKKLKDSPVSASSHEVDCGLRSTEPAGHKQSMRVVGNSHSLHILPMLKRIGGKCGWNVIHEKYPDYITFPDGFNNAIDRLDEVLAPLKAGDMLILSSRNRNLYQVPYLNASGDKWVYGHLRKGDITYRMSRWLKELDIIISQTKPMNIQVVLILPNVEFNVPVIKQSLCQGEWFQHSPAGCNPRASVEFLNSRFSDLLFLELENRVMSHQNFHVFNPLPIYCKGNDSCSRKTNEIFAFKDTNHLTPEGSLLMLEAFNEFLITRNLIE